MALIYRKAGRSYDLDQAVELAFKAELPWDRELVRRALWQAARWLFAVKIGASDFPFARWSHWPDIVHSVDERIEIEKARRNRTRPPVPSPAEIDRMDDAISWLLVLTDQERRIVWAKASVRGCSWEWLANYYGVSASTVRRTHKAAIFKILDRLAVRQVGAVVRARPRPFLKKSAKRAGQVDQVSR